MVKNVITNLDSSKASGCAPVVVLKICEPELSYVLTELFNMRLKESCFAGCWKVSLVGPAFKNAGEIFTAQLKTTVKNYHPISILFVVSKVFEKIVKNRIVDH